jgi:hypothetical protein
VSDPTDLTEIIPDEAKKRILTYQQHSAIDQAGSVYYVLRQPLKETPENITSVGSPSLFAIQMSFGNASSTEVSLHLKAGNGGGVGGESVPTMESLQYDATGKALVAVGRKGEVYTIDTDGGVAQVAAMWPSTNQALLARGLTAFDQSTRTLYAISSQPQPGGNDPVCGNTHGPITCFASFSTLQLGTTPSATPKNMSFMKMCFNGANSQLGCRGTNIQRMFFDPISKKLIGVTRSGKYGPGVSSLDISTPQTTITSVYSAPRPGSDVYEFVSDGTYDDGVNPTNPAAFDYSNGVLYTQFRTGVKHYLFGVSIADGLVSKDEVEDSWAPKNGEPMANLEIHPQ